MAMAATRHKPKPIIEATTVSLFIDLCSIVYYSNCIWQLPQIVISNHIENVPVGSKQLLSIQTSTEIIFQFEFLSLVILS